MSGFSKTLAAGLSFLGRSVLTLAISWLVGLGIVQLAQHVLGGWAAPQTGQLLACAIGVVVAFRLRATAAMYFLAGMVAFSASELLIHAVYGNGAAQGAPTHFAVMGAGISGVVLGALLAPGGGYLARVSSRSVGTRISRPLSPATRGASDTGASDRSNSTLEPSAPAPM